VQLYPLKIPHGLLWDWSRTFEVRSR